MKNIVFFVFFLLCKVTFFHLLSAMIGCVILLKSNDYNFRVQALPHVQVATIADGHHLTDEVKAK